MDLSNIVAVLAGLALGILLLLIVWAVVVRRRADQIEQSEPASSLEAVADARIDSNEMSASVVSEQIEEMVKQKLAQYPDLSSVRLDFGTGVDESLVIWVGDQRYNEVQEIPDERIRNAITESVQAFNQ